MLTEKQLEIFEVLARNPFAEFTRTEIKRESGEKSNNYLALAISQFKKEGIILEKKVGKSGLLRLDLNNDLTLEYIALANRQLRITKKIVSMSIDRLKEEIETVTPFYSLVVFGSYAAGEEKKDSDLDIAVLIETPEKRKLIEAAINGARLKSVIELDAHVIPKTEFMELLTNDEENLGKQIARKHMTVHNNRIFYGLVMEGMKHGFRI